jgi:transcriptional regulator with XRE-family HTH domain
MNAARHPGLGALLRDARQKAGLTQAELARRASTSQAAISDIERGRVQPSAQRLDRLLGMCGRRLAAVPGAAHEIVDPHDLQLLRLNLALPAHERLAQQVRLLRLRGLVRR